MRRIATATAVAIAALAVGLAIPASAQAATSPRPGQFCSAADRGDVVKTKAYGSLTCKADVKNDRYSRWR